MLILVAIALVSADIYENSDRNLLTFKPQSQEQFWLAFDSVDMRGTEDNAKNTYLFAHSAKEARMAYSSSFVAGWILTGRHKMCFPLVADSTIIMLKTVSPGELMRAFVNAPHSKTDLVVLFNLIDNFYDHPGFGEEANFGILQKTAENYPQLAEFQLLKRTRFYQNLKYAVSE